MIVIGRTSSARSSLLMREAPSTGAFRRKCRRRAGAGHSDWRAARPRRGGAQLVAEQRRSSRSAGPLRAGRRSRRAAWPSPPRRRRPRPGSSPVGRSWSRPTAIAAIPARAIRRQSRQRPVIAAPRRPGRRRHGDHEIGVGAAGRVGFGHRSRRHRLDPACSRRCRSRCGGSRRTARAPAGRSRRPRREPAPGSASAPAMLRR